MIVIVHSVAVTIARNVQNMKHVHVAQVSYFLHFHRLYPIMQKNLALTRFD